MLKSIAKLSVFVCTFFVFNPAFADYVAALYDVEIPVADEYTESRNLAFQQGLDEVFVRISGDSIVMDGLKRPPASRYVKQFSYEPVIEPLTDEEGKELTHLLKIQYNGHLMEQYLLDNGFAVWDKYRPDVVIWLVIRDGSNEYVLKDTDISLFKTATNEALTRRGIPQRWPLFDSEDTKILSVADIRGGFKEPVIKASKRYSKGPSLAGSIIWNGSRWLSSWSLLVGTENRHWNYEDSDYNRLINNAIDQAADALGGLYAIHNEVGNQQFAKIQLDVQAVSSIEKYRYVENFLAYLNLVESSRPLKIDNQNAVFEVILRGSEEDFLNIMKNDDAFIKLKTQPADTSLTVDAGKYPEAAKQENTGTTVEQEVDIVSSQPERTSVYHYKLKQ